MGPPRPSAGPASGCRSGRCALRTDRAESIGRSGWSCRLRLPLWFRAAPVAAGPSPRRGRGPTPRSWRSSSRSRPGYGRPRERRHRRGYRCPAAEPQADQPARRGSESVLGILSVQPRLDRRAPETVGCVPVSRPPCAMCSCSFTRSQPGGRLGHRMLDLQPGVDLHERGSCSASGSRKELPRCRHCGSRRRRTQLHGPRRRIAPAPRGVEHRRRPTPRGPSDAGAAACSHGCPNRPRGAVTVGDHLSPRGGGRPASSASRYRRWGRRRQVLPRRHGRARRQRERLGSAPSRTRPDARGRRRPAAAFSTTG